VEHLRVGLVGYGTSGRSIHTPLLKALGQHVTVVVTRTRGEQVAADWPRALVVPDVPALLARSSGLDLVVVASPTGSHAAHVGELLEAGLPVLVDKPLATTEKAASELVRLATRHGGRLTVFQNRRYDTEQLTLAAVLRRGDLGRVHRFERRWERFRPIPQQRWKELDPEAGGLLLDLGSHLVDSAMQLFGPVTTVSAELRAITTPALDDVFLALTHAPDADGHQVISHLTAGALVGAPGPRTRVLGDKAAYLVTRYEAEATPYAVLDEGRKVPPHEGWLVRGAQMEPVPAEPGEHADLYRAVVRWVVEGGPAPVDPLDAVRVARVLDAAKVAAAEGRAVKLT
jgi:predicted dehydrogenase